MASLAIATAMVLLKECSVPLQQFPLYLDAVPLLLGNGRQIRLEMKLAELPDCGGQEAKHMRELRKQGGGHHPLPTTANRVDVHTRVTGRINDSIHVGHPFQANLRLSYQRVQDKPETAAANVRRQEPVSGRNRSYETLSSSMEIQ